MQTQLSDLKLLKKHAACVHLKKLVKSNADNSVANLHLLYTVNRESFNMLLREKFHEELSECMKNIIDALIYLIKTQPNFLKNTIENFSNEYELDFHSLHVAIYALTLGFRLQLDEKELKNLATAALFMDVGLKVVDEHINDRSMSLESDETKNIQKHPIYSVQIAEHNHIHNPYIIDAIRHHHERYDGSGYPDGLTKKQMSKFSSILAICDTFDALTSDRPYRKRFSYFEALNFMLNDEKMKGKYNEKYLAVLLKSLI